MKLYGPIEIIEKIQECPEIFMKTRGIKKVPTYVRVVIYLVPQSQVFM